MSEPVRFQGETNWDAIVEYGAMDIVQEQRFEEYCSALGMAKTSSLANLREAYLAWGDVQEEEWSCDGWCSECTSVACAEGPDD